MKYRKLKAALVESGQTYASFARRMSDRGTVLSEQTLTRIVTGRLSPSMALKQAIARELNRDVRDLFNGQVS